MDRVLNYRAEIFGFLIIWIVVFHIERVIGLPINLPIVTPFIQRGNCAVDIFMFLSGFCLCLSLKREYNLRKFYAKRFKRVVISYLFVAIPFFIWKSLEEYSTARLAHFFFDFSGLSFWFRGCQNTWFVHAILAFYIITPLFFQVIRKDLKYAILCLAILYIINVLAFVFWPLYRHSSVALMRMPIFYLGLLLAYYLPHFDFQNRRISLFLFLLLGALFLLFVPSRGFYCWALYGFFVIPFLWILSFTFERLSKTVLTVFSSFGKLSLEIYLCHITILHIFLFYKVVNSIGFSLYCLLPFLSITCSYMVAYFSERIIKKFNVINKIA